MANQQNPSKTYVPTIGIECHVQLGTNTKLFSAVANDAKNAEPNSLISHICLGMPGALPVLNAEVLNMAIKMAFAFNTTPSKNSFFERKHYFYPDLPKGYQITQLSSPIIVGGNVEINVNGSKKSVRLNRVQIEEDAGKSTHPKGKDFSLVDLNRAGTPLLEIVSEPDIHNSAEAKAYARELWLLARYAGVSDADMYHGNMRFDVNVSISNSSELGIRTETKNLNSFRSVERAVEYEIARQTELLKAGNTVVQETRGWDDSKQKTFTQRSKEEAHDYRYFPDPDIPPLEINEDEIAAIQTAMPTMPSDWRAKLGGIGLDIRQIEILLEAELDDDNVGYLGIIDSFKTDKILAKKVSDWLVNVEIPLRRGDETLNTDMTDKNRGSMYSSIYELLSSGKLSSTNAKALITTLLKSGATPKDLGQYAQQQGLIQLSDETDLKKLVEKVIADNSKAAQDVQNGEAKAIGFLVGQVMKHSEGKANPGMVSKIIRELLGV